MSSLWHEFKRHRAQKDELSLVTYDWFVLSLDFLYSIGAVTIEDGLLRRYSS